MPEIRDTGTGHFDVGRFDNIVAQHRVTHACGARVCFGFWLRITYTYSDMEHMIVAWYPCTVSK